MAETNPGASSATVVAIVAIVLLVLIGFFVIRGSPHRGIDQGSRSNIQINIPRPTAPGK